MRRDASEFRRINKSAYAKASTFAEASTFAKATVDESVDRPADRSAFAARP